MTKRQRITAGAAAGLLVAAITAAGVRAGTGGKADDDHALLVSAEAHLASIDSLKPELAAARAEANELRRQLAGREAELEQMSERGTISVVGQGRATAAPDVMSVSVGVSLRRATVREALAGAERAARRVIAALRSHGVRSRDIQTEWVSVGQEWDYETGRPVGYRVTNTVRAQIRDLRRAGEVLGAAAEAGGNASRLDGVSFQVENAAEMQRAARRAAMRAARSKAEEYAALAGRRLGAVLSISENVSSPGHASAVGVAGLVLAPSPPSIPIEPGRRAVSVSIAVVWALE